jgi:hypothetical protein
MSPSKKNWSAKGLCRRYLSEFIDWRYSQSCWYFRLIFVNCCPSKPSLWFTSPPFLPNVNKYTVYTYISILNTLMQCVKRGGGYGVLDLGKINTCRKVPLHVIFWRWRHFALPSMSFIFLRFNDFLITARIACFRDTRAKVHETFKSLSILFRDRINAGDMRTTIFHWMMPNVSLSTDIIAWLAQEYKFLTPPPPPPCQRE